MIIPTMENDYEFQSADMIRTEVDLNRQHEQEIQKIKDQYRKEIIDKINAARNSFEYHTEWVIIKTTARDKQIFLYTVAVKALCFELQDKGYKTHLQIKQEKTDRDRDPFNESFVLKIEW